MTIELFTARFEGCIPFLEQGFWFARVILPETGFVIFGGTPALDQLAEGIKEFTRLYFSLPPESRHVMTWAPIEVTEADVVKA